RLRSADATTPGSCAGKYSVTRTWTAKDACGTTSTASKLFILAALPTSAISALPAAWTIECPASPSFATPTATDACDPAPSLTSADATTPGSCAGKYSVTRTWTAKDACGNSSTASQTVNVTDTAAPAISAL